MITYMGRVLFSCLSLFCTSSQAMEPNVPAPAAPSSLAAAAPAPAVGEPQSVCSLASSMQGLRLGGDEEPGSLMRVEDDLQWLEERLSRQPVMLRGCDTGAEVCMRVIPDKEFIAKVVCFLVGLMVPLLPFSQGDPVCLMLRGEPRDYSLERWIGQILRVSEMPRIVVVLACMNLKIIITRYHRLQLTTANVRRLFLISCLVASKVLLDVVYLNKGWVTISNGRFPLTEINTMELEFLNLLGCQVLTGFVDSTSAVSRGEMTFDQFVEHFIRDVPPVIDRARLRFLGEAAV